MFFSCNAAFGTADWCRVAGTIESLPVGAHAEAPQPPWRPDLSKREGSYSDDGSFPRFADRPRTGHRSGLGAEHPLRLGDLRLRRSPPAESSAARPGAADVIPPKAFLS